MRNEGRYIVLLSGGLDSTVNLKLASQKGDVILALTYDYGQIASHKEIKSSALICERMGVPHKLIELHFFKELSKSGIIKGEIPLLKDVKEAGSETMEKVWVPARNLVFISIAIAFAEEMQADAVVCGFNKEEAQTFPDNSP